MLSLPSKTALLVTSKPISSSPSQTASDSTAFAKLLEPLGSEEKCSSVSRSGLQSNEEDKPILFALDWPICKRLTTGKTYNYLHSQRPIMLFNYLDAFTFLALALTTRADWSNGTWIPPTNCEVAASLGAANATGSTSFPGVVFDQSTGEISSTPSSNWSLIVSLTEITTSSSSKEGLINYLLDTSSTLTTNATTLPYNACVIVWISESERGNACRSPTCLEALTRQYEASARQVAEQMRQGNSAYTDARDVCNNMLSMDSPDECGDPTQRSSTCTFFLSLYLPTTSIPSPGSPPDSKHRYCIWPPGSCHSATN